MLVGQNGHGVGESIIDDIRMRLKLGGARVTGTVCDSELVGLSNVR